MSQLGKMQDWQDGKQIDRSAMDYKLTRRKADRHYNPAEECFVPDSSRDSLISDLAPIDCWQLTSKDGAEIANYGEIPEHIWYGTVGGELHIVIDRQFPRNYEEFKRIVAGESLRETHTAPIRYAEDIQPPGPASMSKHLVHWDYCPTCNAPIADDSDTACGYKGRVYCTEHCADLANVNHYAEPPKPREFTVRYGWRIMDVPGLGIREVWTPMAN